MISFDSYAKNVRPRGSYRFLEDNETIHSNDLCREIYGWSGSDYVDHDDFKRMNWASVTQAMPAWIGRTLSDYNKFPRSSGLGSEMEVIRPLYSGRTEQYSTALGENSR